MLKKKNIVIGVTVLTVVLSSGVMAFAATSTNNQIEKTRSTIMESLTDTQREAIQQARINSKKEAISYLVDKGTITQAEADKLPELKNESKEINSMTALTEAQRTALNEEEKAVFESQLATLIKDGTITQTQADQMEQGHKMMQSTNLTDDQKTAIMQAKENAMKQAAANLLEKGTLTQDEANAISAMQPKGDTDRDNDANILTEVQKTALNETVKENLENKLTALVKDGTITQTQADQLLSDNNGPHMGFGGKHGHGPDDQSKDDQSTETQDTAL